MKALITSLFLSTFVISLHADVVINEILHDSEPNTVCEEFIELYNSGPDDVDISGWYFSDGIEFTFPAGSLLRSGGYVVVIVAGSSATTTYPPNLSRLPAGKVNAMPSEKYQPEISTSSGPEL